MKALGGGPLRWPATDPADPNWGADGGGKLGVTNCGATGVGWANLFGGCCETSGIADVGIVVSAKLLADAGAASVVIFASEGDAVGSGCGAA